MVKSPFETEDNIHILFRGYTISLKSRPKKYAEVIFSELMVWDEKREYVTHTLVGKNGAESYKPNPTGEDVYAVMKAIARKKPVKKEKVASKKSIQSKRRKSSRRK